MANTTTQVSIVFAISHITIATITLSQRQLFDF